MPETLAPPRGGVPAQRPSASDRLDIQHFGKPLRELSDAEFDSIFPGESAPAPAKADPAESTTPWRLFTVTNVQEQAIKWLWPGRIALGKLNMLAGDPGLGKSYIITDIAARVSTGAAWPDGEANENPGGVLLVNAEDGLADTIKPRLRVAQANTDRVVFMPAIDEGRLFSLSKHLDILAWCAAQVPDLRLIALDPVSAFFSGVDSHKNTDVREVLTPLADLAEKTGAAVCVVTHLNKGFGQAVYRGMGSLAVTAACRSMWVVAKDPQDRARRLFLPVKNNLGNDRMGLAYGLVDSGDPCKQAIVDWKEPVDVNVDDVLNPMGRSMRRPSATAAADEWLKAFLDNSEKASTDVIKAGEAAGFSEKQLRNSRTRVGVTIRRAGIPPSTFWSLGGDEPDEAPEDTAAVAAPEPTPTVEPVPAKPTPTAVTPTPTPTPAPAAPAASKGVRTALYW